jgi:dihydroflavonol-4-reductase
VARTAFVTGSTGFVGLNLVEELSAQGWRVVAMHRAQSDVGLLDQFPGVTRCVGDVTDLHSLRSVIPPEVDCVFHVAGNTSLWARQHAEQLKVNVRGTRNMVKAALEAKAQRFVMTSSIVAYGLHGGTVTEDTPTRGIAARINYVRSKALAERELRRGLALGLKGVILNPANIMGAYDTANWSRMFRLVKQGRLPAVPPGGGSFCHAREVARMHVAAAERGRIGHSYLLGGAQSSYLGLVRLMADMLGVRRRPVALPPRVLKLYAGAEEFIAPLFRREPDITRDAVELLSENIYCNSRKAQQELGYEPQPLSRMLEDCYQWMRSQNLI